MKRKCNEVSKLKNEIFEMENRSPPHNRNTEMRNLEQHFKMEIHNLEQYITQIQSDQEELQEKNYHILEDVSSVSSQYSIILFVLI